MYSDTAGIHLFIVFVFFFLSSYIVFFYASIYNILLFIAAGFTSLVLFNTEQQQQRQNFALQLFNCLEERQQFARLMMMIMMNCFCGKVD